MFPKVLFNIPLTINYSLNVATSNKLKTIYTFKHIKKNLFLYSQHSGESQSQNHFCLDFCKCRPTSPTFPRAPLQSSVHRAAGKTPSKAKLDDEATVFVLLLKAITVPRSKSKILTETFPTWPISPSAASRPISSLAVRYLHTCSGPRKSQALS